MQQKKLDIGTGVHAQTAAPRVIWLIGIVVIFNLANTAMRLILECFIFVQSDLAMSTGALHTMEFL